MSFFRRAYVLPVLVLILIAVAPLVLGGETLFLRDVFNTHLEMKWFQAQAMSEGRLPLIDPNRGGGQAHLGNPNTVALYPDNLLYLVTPPIWALNAHFWLHLLLAPFALSWLAREWGLERRAAWAAGVFFGLSGFFLSTLNLYNLVAPVTLAPALAAAVLALGRAPAAPGRMVASALLWALMLLAGDPITAVVGLVLAASALVLRDGWRAARAWSQWLALGLGTLIAAPQWLEFLRAMPHTYRQTIGYSPEAALVSSWNPAAALEWLLPLVQGPPALDFWGQAFSGGDVPLLFSLYPGLLAIVCLLMTPARGGRLATWAWLLIGVGLFFSLGRYNPILVWASQLPGVGLLRLPIKLWLLVAVGSSLLAARGFERIVEGGATRRFHVVLAALGALLTVAVAVLLLVPNAFVGMLEALLRTALPPDLAARQTGAWLRSALLSLALLGVALGVTRWGRGRPSVGALLLGVHAAAQLLVLRPLMPMDEVAPYLEPPALTAEISPGATVVHGGQSSLFGSTAVDPSAFESGSLHWLQRRTFDELYPPAGIMSGLRYQLDSSAEGLDSYLTRVTAQAVAAMPDPDRLRLVRASAVDYLVLDRELEGKTDDQTRLVARRDLSGGSVYLYELRDTAEEVRVVGDLLFAPHLNAAAGFLTATDFDPGYSAVLPGTAPRRRGRAGRVLSFEQEPERWVARVDAPDGGAVIFARTYLPLLRARVDGIDAEIQVANMHHSGVVVTPGAHEVELWVDRRPFRQSLLVAALGVLLMLLAVRRLDRIPLSPAAERGAP